MTRTVRVFSRRTEKLIAERFGIINPVTDVSNFAIPIRVVKTGTTPEAFLITLTNDEAQITSPELEIYVRYH